MKFDVEQVRTEFPILDQKVNGKQLIYLDNAATSQKPLSVINALSDYYLKYNANIHRGLHALADQATAAFEETRTLIKEFLNAKSTKEIIFTYGTTDGINLIANSFGNAFINKDDEILISTMEHHSNIVPWQLLCEQKGCKLKVIPLNNKQEIDMEAYKSLLSNKTKIVSVVHISNSLGVINPIKEMAKLAHQVGAKILVDGAQSVAHLPINLQDLDVDFFVSSAHKFYGPTGSGFLYGKEDILNAMPPYRGGGEMIKEVDFEKSTYNELPYKFEAGTPNIADIIAVKEAIKFISKFDRTEVEAYEQDLLDYAQAELLKIDGLKIFGTSDQKVSVVSFNIEGIHPQDLGLILDQQGIAIRTGHHCTQPLMKSLKIPGTARASFTLYNTKKEVDQLIIALNKAKRLLT